jgi:hypothetical protein
VPPIEFDAVSTRGTCRLGVDDVGRFHEWEDDRQKTLVGVMTILGPVETLFAEFDQLGLNDAAGGPCPTEVDARRRQLLSGRFEVGDGQTNLSHVVAATHPSGRFARGLNGRQQQADQNADDGDDHEQLHERKSTASLTPAVQ